MNLHCSRFWSSSHQITNPGAQGQSFSWHHGWHSTRVSARGTYGASARATFNVANTSRWLPHSDRQGHNFHLDHSPQDHSDQARRHGGVRGGSSPVPKAATQGSDGAIHHVDSEYQCRYNLRNGKGSLDEDLTLMTRPALSLLKPVFGGYPQMI